MNKDLIVQQVINKFETRSALGIAKYGTTLHDNNTDDFLTHLQEELMDATLYVEKLRQSPKQLFIKNTLVKDSEGIVLRCIVADRETAIFAPYSENPQDGSFYTNYSELSAYFNDPSIPNDLIII
jgi:hypothetical protein